MYHDEFRISAGTRRRGQASLGKQIVLDEVHRLRNPSQPLEIAADSHPDVRVIATGSSTLNATSTFRDSLAGRKRDIWLTPKISSDLTDFENQDIPELLLANSGGIVEATKYARACEVSRTIMTNYLNVFEATRVVRVIRPFGRNRSDVTWALPVH